MNAKALAIKLKYKWRGSVEWQMTSSELRAYAKSLHGVGVDLHTYGSCFDDAFNGGGGVYPRRPILLLRRERPLLWSEPPDGAGRHVALALQPHIHWGVGLRR